MWKLLSAIFLVVLLDVAFVWMMALEPESIEIAQATGPTSAIPVIHEQPATEPIAIDDSTEPIVDERFAVRDARVARSFSRSANGADRVAQPEVGTAAATAPAKLFQDTIIWIGRTEVPVKIESRDEALVIAESKPEAMSARVVEPKATAKAESKKRSFGSKTLGVIRKPYDWMKTVVDKLH